MLNDEFICTGAWSPASSDLAPWIQANFDDEKRIRYITTQGRSDADEWVSTYLVMYDHDPNNWYFVTDSTGRTKVFTANTDRNTVVTYDMLPYGLTANIIRLWPLASFNGARSMRFMVQACDYLGK